MKEILEEKKKRIDTCVINVDSEWGSDDIWLTCQILVTIPEHGDRLFIYYNKDFQKLFEKKKSTYLQRFHQRMKGNGLKDSIPTPQFIPWEMWKSSENETSETEIHSNNDDNIFDNIASNIERNIVLKDRDEIFVFDDVLERISSELSLDPVKSFEKVQGNFFFSLRDVYFLFSEKFIEKMFTKSFGDSKKDYITSKNAIFGTFQTFTGKRVTLHDYTGISSSFKNFLLLLSIPHPLKDELRKDCMEKELVDNFETFLDYAIHDVLALSMCEKKLKEKMDYIKYSVLSIPKDENPKRWSEKHLPSTVGRLVSNMFGDYIESVFQKEGIGNELLNRFRILNKKMRLTQSNLTGKKKIKREEKGGKKDDIISDLCSGSSIDSYYHLYANNTGIFNALTSGGRCRNEQWYILLKKIILQKIFLILHLSLF